MSFGKCEAVLSVKGHRRLQIMKKYTRVRNGVPHLVLRGDHDILIPLKSEIPYLGILLSYGAFEYNTAQHRCKQAWMNYKALRQALRTNGALSSAERLRIYRVCIWPVVEYGLCGTGLDSRRLGLVESTVAQQLRKVLRIHERGVSNREVFIRADLDPRIRLEGVFRNQYRRIAGVGAGSVIAGMHDRAFQVQEHFKQIVETVGATLTPLCAQSGVPCPVCGVYFDSEAGVALHIQRRHAEVHQGAKVSFDRAKHCLDGLPKCVFCLSVLGDMQAMDKHVASGGCAVSKQAIAEGEDIAALRLRLCEVRAREAAHTPQSDMGPGLGVHDPSSLGFLDQPPHVVVRDHSAAILSWSPCCMLCGQRMLDIRRVKTHWQAVRKDEWSRHSSSAKQLCGTLSKAVRRPCQFCQSGAKDSNAHAAQCPLLFHAMLIHCLRAQSIHQATPSQLRAVLPRRSEQVAQYKSFQLSSTPLGLAFRKGASASSKQPSSAAPTQESVEKRTVSNGAQTQQSKLGMFFRSARGHSGGVNAGYGIWTLGLRLRNPHSLCYLNAGVLSLVHFLEVTGLSDYAALVQVCRQAQGADRELCLSQQLVVRSMFAGWRFSSVQRDCAELLTQALAQRQGLWSEWELRDMLQEVRETGASPIILPLPDSGELTLQALVDQWCSSGGDRSLTSSKPVMVQFGRSTEHGKNHPSISFDGSVHFPVRRDAGVETCVFDVLSGVVHIGQRVTSGHYRAILKLGSQ